MSRVLLIDNYDSFTYNLAHLLQELGADVTVIRNDRIDADGAEAFEPTHLVISPGPGRPADSGATIEIVRRLGPRMPTLGVCLGHQSMVAAFGGEIRRGDPIHGKDATIDHDGRTLFTGLPNPLLVGRYHSLVAAPELPGELELSASCEGVVMAVRHRRLPAEGVQFHPESVLTPDGKEMLGNFLAAVAD